MSQLAILPIRNARITAGYKNAAYLRGMGFSHFGIDMTDKDRFQFNLAAPFDLEIVAFGNDTLMGRTIIAKSLEPVNVHYGPKRGDHNLVLRLAHLSVIGNKASEVGARLKRGEYLGQYGNTGRYGGAPHLHVELDTDTRWPTYSPTLSRHSNIWKAGTDSTINPMDCFKVASHQSLWYSRNSGSWLTISADATTLDHHRRVVTGKPHL